MVKFNNWIKRISLIMVLGLGIYSLIHLGTETILQDKLSLHSTSSPSVDKDTGSSSFASLSKASKEKPKSSHSINSGNLSEEPTATLSQASSSSTAAEEGTGKNQLGPAIPVKNINTFFGTNLKDVIDTPELTFEVDGKNITAYRDSYQVNYDENSYVWMGKTDHKDNHLVIISHYKGFVGAHITRDDGTSYTLQYDGPMKHHILRRITTMYLHNDTTFPNKNQVSNEMKKEEEPIFPTTKAAAAGSASQIKHIAASNLKMTSEEGSASAPAGAPVVVDVVMGYTKDALKTMGTHDALVASANSTIALTNKIASNSLSTLQLRLVNVSPINYTATEEPCAELDKISGGSATQYTQLKNLRDKYGADLATLLTAQHPDSTIGCAMFPPDPEEEPNANIATSTYAGKSAIVVQYFNTQLFAHEWGHNFSLAHENNCGGGMKPYGCANSFKSKKCVGGTCFTAMWSIIYRDTSAVPYYSNPDVLYDGVATGIANKRDEARALNEVVAYIASIRSPIADTGTIPTISSVSGNQTVVVGANVSLSVVASSSEAMTYQWKKDGSTLVDNGTYSGSNSSSLRINNIQKVNAGQYQVVVTNSKGSAASSNISVVVNDAPPVNPPPVPVNRAPIAQAGLNQTVAINSVVQLNGSGSSDPDKNTIFYQWTQMSGPPVSLSDPNSAKPTFTATSPGSLVFSLIVSDTLLVSAASQVTITVTSNEDEVTNNTLALTNLNTSNTVLGNVVAGYRFQATRKIRITQLIIDTSLSGSSNNVNLYRRNSNGSYTRINSFSISTGTTRGTLNPATIAKVDITLNPGVYVLGGVFSAFNYSTKSAVQVAPGINLLEGRIAASTTSSRIITSYYYYNNYVIGHINFSFDPL